MKNKMPFILTMIATGGLAALALPFVPKNYTSPKERMKRRLERRRRRLLALKKLRRDKRSS